MKGIFVTGTDTEVGKTVVAAAVMHRYRETVPLCYWKPVQTGIEAHDDTETVRGLGECQEQELFRLGVRLPGPFSPHLSARLSGTVIDLSNLLDFIQTKQSDRAWVVEGAGGILVPLNTEELMIDLISRLDLPVLVVARSGLGTINHTLLTLEVLRYKAIRVLGIVMVGGRNLENRQAIEEYGHIDVLGEIPMFDTITPELIRQWACCELDRKNALLRVLI